jgi:hypothetical protein
MMPRFKFWDGEVQIYILVTQKKIKNCGVGCEVLTAVVISSGI